MKKGNLVCCQKVLSQKDYELFDMMLSAYEHLMLRSKRYATSYVKRISRDITNLACYTQLPPWQWTEEHFIKWCESHNARNLTAATQRNYKSSINMFLQYFCASEYWKHKIKNLTGYTPTDFAPHLITTMECLIKRGTKQSEPLLFNYKNVLAPQDCELYESILHVWEAYMRGAKRHTEAAFKHSVVIVNNFIAFSGVAPWNWTEKDFDKWSIYLNDEKRFSTSNVWSYQIAIRLFLKYVTENHKLLHEIKKATGHYPKQICTADRGAL